MIPSIKYSKVFPVDDVCLLFLDFLQQFRHNIIQACDLSPNIIQAMEVRYEEVAEIHWLNRMAWLSKNPAQIDAWNATEKKTINGVEHGRYDASIYYLRCF